MYQKFREDPSSVDPSWHEFLVDYSPEPTTETHPTIGNGQPAQAPVASPEPAPAPAPAPKADAGNGVAAAPAKAPEPPKPAAKPAAPPITPAEGSESQVLRGAAAAVVKNMSASLEVPTATSVRAIPAKLLIDNRIVINNHLKRTRGGKISFTHLIGYAVVRALAEHPEMNRHYTADEQAKPAVVVPEHVNLGLAIDLKTGKGR